MEAQLLSLVRVRDLIEAAVADEAPVGERQLLLEVGKTHERCA